METIDVEDILDVSLNVLDVETDIELEIRRKIVLYSSPNYGGSWGALDSPTAPPGALSRSPESPDGPKFLPLFFGQLNQDLTRSILTDISENDYTPYAITFTYPDISVNYKRTVFSDKKKKMVIRTYNCSLSEAPEDIQHRKITRDINSWMNNIQKHLPTSSNIKQIAVCFEKTKNNIIHGHGILTMNNRYVQAVSQVMEMYWIKISKGNYKAMHKVKGRHVDNAFDKCNNVEKWVEYIMKECKGFIFPLGRSTFTQYMNKRYIQEIFPCENIDKQIMPDISWQEKKPIFIDFL